jgi:predicted RNase H-like nuclease
MQHGCRSFVARLAAPPTLAQLRRARSPRTATVSRPLAGLDGCPDGWVCVQEDASGLLSARVAASFASAVASLAAETLIAVDIPIGLTDTGRRDCDRAARRLLGWPRMTSVFSAPVRGVLGLPDYREANEAHRRIDGRGMSRQSHAIARKIGEVDAVLRAGPPSLRARVVEVHPEVSFCLWNGGVAMRHNKKAAAGRTERRARIDAVWPGEAQRLKAQLDATGLRYGLDDLYDALAALWSARRIRAGTARTLPDAPEADRFGLPMRIVG